MAAMAKRTKVIIGIVAAVAVLAGVGAWWILRDDAAPRASLEGAAERAGEAGSDGDGDAGDGTDTDEAVTDPTGTWSVDEGSFAGYRIDEVFTGGVNNTATARTSDVDGTVTIDGATVTDVEVTVQMGTLESTDGNGLRDGRVGGALDTDAHPTATFTLTEPIDLGSVPEPGEAVTAKAIGDLTLKGVTQQVTVDLEAQLDGSKLLVAGNAPVVLSDFGIDAPSAPRVVSIEDEGELEFQLILSLD